MKNAIEKQALPIILDEQGEPIALLFFNKSRDRIIYTLKKADEDEIIELFQKQTLDGAGFLGDPNPTQLNATSF